MHVFTSQFAADTPAGDMRSMEKDLGWGGDNSGLSKAVRLAYHLQSAMESGRLKEGERLGTKAELLKRYDVSRGTLNEALRLMSSRGYISVKPGPAGGIFVAPRLQRVELRNTILETRGDPVRLSECIRTRDALEVVVSVEAALACDMAAAERLRARLQEVREAANSRARLLAIWTLHREIAVTGRNRVLTAVYLELLDAIQAAAVGLDDEAAEWGVVADTTPVHALLVEAIVRNDASGTEEAARQHSPTDLGATYVSEQPSVLP